MFVRRTNELYHHGIKGQKWGVRRYQNPDGTLTAAGRERYLKELKDDLMSKKSDQIIAERTELQEIRKNILNDPALEDLDKEATELSRQVDKLNEEFKKDTLPYVKQSVMYNGHDPKEDMDEYNAEVSFHFDDDGDQGMTGSAWDMFLRTKGTSYEELDKKAADIFKKKKDIYYKYIDEVLKDIGDEPMSSKAYNTKVKDQVRWVMDNTIDTLDYLDVSHFPNMSGYIYEWVPGSGKEGKALTYAQSRRLHAGLEKLSYDEYDKELAKRLYG